MNLGNLANLFINNLLPILLIAGIGYLCGKFLHIDPNTISKIIFYIFSPCLIFDLLYNSHLSNDSMLRMVGFTTTLAVVVIIVTYLLGRFLKLNRKMIAAVVLTAFATNSGNFGLSLNLFALGESGLAQASIFFVTSALLTYTVGVMVASLGTASFKDSLIRLLKVPSIYALFFSLLIIWKHWQVPLPIERTITTLGNASIPTMLILLGLQLHANHRTSHLKALGLANGMRLVGGAVFGILLGKLFGLQGVAFQAGVIQASTPSAVLSTVLATEYDCEPAFVTTMVFTSTLLSPLTLTPLLAYLGA
jgi:predicted permease